MFYLNIYIFNFYIQCKIKLKADINYKWKYASICFSSVFFPCEILVILCSSRANFGQKKRNLNILISDSFTIVQFHIRAHKEKTRVECALNEVSEVWNEEWGMRNEKWEMEMEMESHQHITHTHVYDARNAGNHKLDLIAPASIWTLTQIYGSPGWESLLDEEPLRWRPQQIMNPIYLTLQPDSVV